MWENLNVLREPDHFLKAGNTGPPFEATLTMGDGRPVPTQNGEFRLVMRRLDSGNTMTVNALGTVTTVNGATVFRYEFQPGETNLPGDYRAEVIVSYFGTDLQITVPNDGYYWVQIGPSLLGLSGVVGSLPEGAWIDWQAVRDTPTTVAGYGLTDAATTAYVAALEAQIAALQARVAALEAAGA